MHHVQRKPYFLKSKMEIAAKVNRVLADVEQAHRLFYSMYELIQVASSGGSDAGGPAAETQSVRDGSTSDAATAMTGQYLALAAAAAAATQQTLSQQQSAAAAALSQSGGVDGTRYISSSATPSHLTQQQQQQQTTPSSRPGSSLPSPRPTNTSLAGAGPSATAGGGPGGGSLALSVQAVRGTPMSTPGGRNPGAAAAVSSAAAAAAAARARQLLAAAESGDIPAALQLAELLRTGAPGISADPSIARALLVQAADAGDAEALCRLGDMCEAGEGRPAAAADAAAAAAAIASTAAAATVAPSGERHGAASPYTRRAGEVIGSTAATGFFGTPSRFGRGSSPFAAGSAALRASTLRLNALTAPGAWPATGGGAFGSSRSARRDLVSGRDQHNPPYLSPSGGGGRGYDQAVNDEEDEVTARLPGVTDVDLMEAAGWYKAASDAGSMRGRACYAFALERGRGVPRDISAAVLLYKQAALADEPTALNNLGRLLLQGKALAADPATAAALFYRAAQLGSAAGRINLAACCALGLGVPADEGLAEQHLRAAHALGHPLAQPLLSQLLASRGQFTRLQALTTRPDFQPAA